MMPPKKNEKKGKLVKSKTEVTLLERDANGKWPLDMTAEQIGMLTLKEKGEYVMQVVLTNLNRNAGQDQ
jgi:hypothetical protein